ncbi:MAG: phytanoyl-CoA dioxygenase family protein [Acidimicrobiales bacterium]|jgi:ectoine hydroxylase-related dioxygenase (phytanoyl-CoA dioxygenase family)|tara:strand:- start:487 stop:1389 length:903 start_codon:yes stop_codon:yes gene_type:complete
MSTTAMQTRLSPQIQELELEQFVLQLEVDGLCVVPPERTGVAPETINAIAEQLLSEAQEVVGCEFDLNEGPKAELTMSADENVIAQFSGDRGEPTQFLVQQLCARDRLFRDLAINPVGVALIRHLIGQNATRFSSHNAFIKWQGEFGYGQNLGLHCDQMAVPRPWGRNALTANTNWCITDYSLDGGALAYVPGSHRRMEPPRFPEAVELAVPVEAPAGSLIVFHGATWHGAFPRLTEGMRLSIANYFRHYMVLPQDDIKNLFPQELAEDCDDPDMFKFLAGFADEFPYSQQTERVPRLVL